jgi:pimeloyl-ACP methyl ester carboxylesterase
MRAPLLGHLLWQTMAVPSFPAGQLTDFVDPARFPDWLDRYRVQMRYRGFGRALSSTIRALAATDIAQVYGRVGHDTMPVLLVWGEEDHTVPFALSDSVRRWIPRAEFRPIRGAGHLPQLERASVVNPMLTGFFRAHDAGAPAAR